MEKSARRATAIVRANLFFMARDYTKASGCPEAQTCLVYLWRRLPACRGTKTATNTKGAEEPQSNAGINSPRSLRAPLRPLRLNQASVTAKSVDPSVSATVSLPCRGLCLGGLLASGRQRSLCCGVGCQLLPRGARLFEARVVSSAPSFGHLAGTGFVLGDILVAFEHANLFTARCGGRFRRAGHSGRRVCPPISAFHPVSLTAANQNGGAQDSENQ